MFSCNCVSHMTNYVNFKLSKDVQKNPGPTQYNTDHEVITRPFMQNHSSTMQLTSPISSENLMQSRLGELGLQSIDVGGEGDCFFRSVSHRGFIKGEAPGKLTGCEQDLAITLPSCFRLLFLLSFIRKT